MTYTVSDIHGRYDKYTELLEAIDFDDNDTLYVIGDVIDRGKESFKTMLDIAARPNVIGLKGNHEIMAINALDRLSQDVTKSGIKGLENADWDEMALWWRNGGYTSFTEFMSLNAQQATTAWNYMINMPLYKEIEVNGQKFVLLHGGLEGFRPERSLSDYSTDEIVWCRPEPDTVYYQDKIVILGHTPTFCMCGTSTPTGIYRKPSYIDIDCGCIYGGQLGCLCLDTMEEIYV